MIGLDLPAGPLSVVCLAAHPDDIEIGCGGTILALSERRSVAAHHLVLTGGEARQAEARVAADLFWGASGPASVETLGLRDGYLPAQWAETKDALEAFASRVQPDVLLAPRLDDSHQDHRLVASLVATAWRDTLVLNYEIPKWDGDLRPVTHYVPLTTEQAHRKVELLDKAFPSQSDRDWWDPETFLGLMRLRGIECRSRYAEGFVTAKAVLSV
ncbi:PIG-L deacetylase family protein [Luteipulveratus mongoliensis]|uniref:GlcNAc-PI de-N-acetylase n=1 Tax=Luteipulveratus mongoliensis TaxID=571913 RepID=A0A0K1JGU9_9MICO|nr:PIG-L deacetylase family protein [Luteipulveratus mongoliensis]AKU15931.1 GlcNAc-PI de-N-acetylase [Luteipulveratus mongoliensis]